MTDGSTMTHRALWSRSRGMSSGTLRTSLTTVPALRIRSFSFWSSAGFAKEIRGQAAPIRTSAPSKPNEQSLRIVVMTELSSCFLLYFLNVVIRGGPLNPARQVPQKSEHRKNQKKKKDNLGDASGSYGNSAESQQSGEQGNDEESESPAQ